jgi:large conductance mechanosensitive channel
VVNFLIVAIVLYIFIVKVVGYLMKAKEAVPPPPSKTEVLLTEIRDLLRARS